MGSGGALNHQEKEKSRMITYEEAVEALKANGNSKRAAARALGMPYSSFYYLLKTRVSWTQRAKDPVCGSSPASTKASGPAALPGGVAGFRELHNYVCIQERHYNQVKALIDKCIDTHLRRTAYVCAGGSETDLRCPRGWFYDNEGPRLAKVSASDWASHRSDYADIQISVTVDGTKSGERLTWVDPDVVAAYKEAALGY